MSEDIHIKNEKIKSDFSDSVNENDEKVENKEKTESEEKNSLDDEDEDNKILSLFEPESSKNIENKTKKKKDSDEVGEGEGEGEAEDEEDNDDEDDIFDDDDYDDDDDDEDNDRSDISSDDKKKKDPYRYYINSKVANFIFFENLEKGDYLYGIEENKYYKVLKINSKEANYVDKYDITLELVDNLKAKKQKEKNEMKKVSGNILFKGLNFKNNKNENKEKNKKEDKTENINPEINEDEKKESKIDKNNKQKNVKTLKNNIKETNESDKKKLDEEKGKEDKENGENKENKEDKKDGDNKKDKKESNKDKNKENDKEKEKKEKEKEEEKINKKEEKNEKKEKAQKKEVKKEKEKEDEKEKGEKEEKNNEKDEKEELKKEKEKNKEENNEEKVKEKDNENEKIKEKKPSNIEQNESTKKAKSTKKNNNKKITVTLTMKDYSKYTDLQKITIFYINYLNFFHKIDMTININCSISNIINKFQKLYHIPIDKYSEEKPPLLVFINNKKYSPLNSLKKKYFTPNKFDYKNDYVIILEKENHKFEEIDLGTRNTYLNLKGVKIPHFVFSAYYNLQVESFIISKNILNLECEIYELKKEMNINIDPENEKGSKKIAKEFLDLNWKERCSLITIIKSSAMKKSKENYDANCFEINRKFILTQGKVYVFLITTSNKKVYAFNPRHLAKEGLVIISKDDKAILNGFKSKKISDFIAY